MRSQQLVSFIYVDVFSSALFEQRGKCRYLGTHIQSVPSPSFLPSSLAPLMLLTVAFFVNVKWGMRTARG